jgi:hypothetical protein
MSAQPALQPTDVLQPLAPLQSRPSLAAAFVQSVTGRDVEVEEHGVRLEDSPGHLGDATGLDASIRYRTHDGRRGVLGIETKLTEQFSPKVYGLDSNPAYRRYSQASSAPFDQARLEVLTDARWNQLWRNQMLCEAIADHEQRELAEQLVLFPDDAGKTACLVAEYATLLRRSDAIVARTLADIVSALEHPPHGDGTSWLEPFRVRYVNLDLSRPLFEAWRSGQPPLG